MSVDTCMDGGSKVVYKIACHSIIVNISIQHLIRILIKIAKCVFQSRDYVCYLFSFFFKDQIAKYYDQLCASRGMSGQTSARHNFKNRILCQSTYTSLNDHLRYTNPNRSSGKDIIITWMRQRKHTQLIKREILVASDD